MNFVLGVGYTAIGFVLIIIGMIVIYLIQKLLSKIPKIKINKKLKHTSREILSFLSVLISLIIIVFYTVLFAFTIGKNIVDLF